MAIVVTCQCGRKLQFDDNKAGKRARCPECGEPVGIPFGSSEDAGSAKTAGGKRSGRKSSRSTWIVAGVVGAVVLVGSACCVVGILGYAFRGLWLPGAGDDLPKDAPALFASIEESVKKGKIQSDEKGILWAKDHFEDVPREGAILIGFETNVTPFAGQPRVESVRPIFLTRNGETLGPWHGAAPAPPAVPTVVKAKPGYVVGNLTIRTGGFLTGLSLTFVKLDGGRLQPEDTYTSDWIGSMEGRIETSGAAGAFPVGICGRMGAGKDVCALGLVLKFTKK
jgi:hypothetical protein